MFELLHVYIIIMIDNNILMFGLAYWVLGIKSPGQNPLEEKFENSF